MQDSSILCPSRLIPALPPTPDRLRCDDAGTDPGHCFTPKYGKPCIVSDGQGSYLKKWNSKRKVFESVNPDFNDVTPGAEAKLQGYPVEKLD